MPSCTNKSLPELKIKIAHNEVDHLKIERVQNHRVDPCSPRCPPQYGHKGSVPRTKRGTEFRFTAFCDTGPASSRQGVPQAVSRRVTTSAQIVAGIQPMIVRWRMMQRIP